MFLRDALNHLSDWKDRPSRRPLIVRGARQVGKSVLVRMFAESQFESLIELNFERNPGISEMFESRDPKTIASLLEVQAGERIEPGSTLLFLDEIQSAPQVLSSLRYFYEEFPELHVIAAGSLLDLELRRPQFSVPVGRIEYLHLGPVQFEEFLGAAGERTLASFLQEWRPGQDIHAAVHDKAMKLFREFLMVGGMPESVSVYLHERSFVESEIVRQSIVSTFRDDFGKYGKRVSTTRLRRVFDRLPAAVGSRTKYSLLDPHSKSRDVAAALELLMHARISYAVRHSPSNSLPLAASASEKKFKMLHLDVGLMLTQMGFRAKSKELLAQKELANAGALAEQVVGQHLLYSDLPYKEPDLYFWARDARNSSAEVDYVLEHDGSIVPVEVKAGKSGTLRSLHAFVAEKESPLAIRFNSDVPSVLPQLTASGKSEHSYQLVSMPLYLVGQTRRIIELLS